MSQHVQKITKWHSSFQLQRCSQWQWTNYPATPSQSTGGRWASRCTNFWPGLALTTFTQRHPYLTSSLYSTIRSISHRGGAPISSPCSRRYFSSCHCNFSIHCAPPADNFLAENSMISSHLQRKNNNFW